MKTLDDPLITNGGKQQAEITIMVPKLNYKQSVQPSVWQTAQIHVELQERKHYV